MALKIRLHPFERVLVGSAVLKNGSSTADFILENTVPVLREKDILSPDKAQTACERLYMAVQLMYVDPASLQRSHQMYWEIAKHILDAAPSTMPYIQAISDLILTGEYYKALKATRRLIRYEGELLSHATNSK